MSRPSAEYVREEPATQPFDLVGLVAGVLFAFAGLAYLFGGHDALSGNSSLVFPTLLVLVGVAGVAGSGLVRRSWFTRTPQPAAEGAAATVEDEPRAADDEDAQG
jgi:hypothetical protein